MKTWITEKQYSDCTLRDEHAIVQLTLAGETREVEIVRPIYTSGSPSDRWDTVKDVALFSKGRGGKLWPGRISFWVQADGSLKPGFNRTFLNRSGYRAIAWVDKVEGHRSEHNSARIG